MSETVSTARAAELLHVGPSSVKRWADLGQLACVRTVGGHRRFAVSELERFARTQISAPRTDTGELARRLLHASNVHQVLGVIFEARGRTEGWWEVADQIGEALEEIGSQWERGQLTVIDEHTASARLGRALSWLVDATPTRPEGRRYLLVAATDEHHTLGLSLAELCLREAGWHGDFVGSMPPVDEVALQITRGGFDLVGVSASRASKDPSALAALCERLRVPAQQAGATLVLGGAGPWPATLGYGSRVTTFRQFAQLLRSI